MKRFLADTHAILWFAGGEQRRLGARAARIFDGLPRLQTAIAVSVISLWEVAMLHDEGLIRLSAGFSAWSEALQALQGVSVEPLTVRDVDEARALRDLTDPHDRLIAGTAVRLGVPLLTADRRIVGHRRVKTIW
jgi:PIN domain nuclease of toxin-antitoxin system